MRVIFYNKETKEITEVISIRSLLDLTTEDTQQDYLSFEYSDAVPGMNIESINEDGTIKSVSEQVELGLITLKDDEVLEDETIKKLTDLEMKEKYPDRYPKDPEPTELEKVTNEIQNIEYAVGMEIINEMAQERLLKQTFSNKTKIKSPEQERQEHYLELVKRKNVLENSSLEDQN